MKNKDKIKILMLKVESGSRNMGRTQVFSAEFKMSKMGQKCWNCNIIQLYPTPLGLGLRNLSH